MGRLKELRKYVDSEINKMEDPDKRIGAIVHLYGVSLAATMIARKRGMNPELASWQLCFMICMHIRQAPMMIMLIKEQILPGRFLKSFN